MTSKKVIVIGGGASGLFAAGRAASLGAEVVLIEKMPSPGKKIRITGKGRCNLGNTAPVRLFVARFGPQGRFLGTAFSHFFTEKMVAFFAQLGVQTQHERGGRIFTKSGRAEDVSLALETWCQKNGVQIECRKTVTDIILESGTVRGVRTRPSDQGKKYSGNTSTSETEEMNADAIVIATGGKSYPGTGSTGDGYQFAAKAGHRINKPKAALVPLETDREISSVLAGLTIKNCTLSVFINQELTFQEFGEVTFMAKSIAGPLILTLSKKLIEEFHNGHSIEFSLDLKPALSQAKLDKRIIRELELHKNSPFEKVLESLLPRQMISLCVKQLGIPSSKYGNQITVHERKTVVEWLKNVMLPMRGYRPIAEALITAGGVSLDEVDAHTMQSRLVSNLYFCGEILDLDAPTGGYNLQAAFSTGWLAGSSVAVTNDQNS